jgi:glycogen debranching enzyme
VKPIKLSKSTVKYLCGASVKTHFDQWKDDPTTHRGIPSELIEISAPVINKGTDSDGEYSKIVVPDVFEPGSIMLFETDMPVS